MADITSCVGARKDVRKDNRNTGGSATYSIADQVARFANAKATGDPRYLDITTVYDGSGLKGQRILITGAEQGLGLELVKEIVKQGGFAIQAGRTSSPDLDAVKAGASDQVQIITGVDVTKNEAMTKMCSDLKEPVDIVINCAGYFYGPAESVGVGREGHLNFPQQVLAVHTRVHMHRHSMCMCMSVRARMCARICREAHLNISRHVPANVHMYVHVRMPCVCTPCHVCVCNVHVRAHVFLLPSPRLLPGCRSSRSTSAPSALCASPRRCTRRS